MKNKKRIAILGGGPSGLFMFKRLVDAGRKDLIIDVFEKKKLLGVGMPYSVEGASDEHITNVSGNEIPMLETSIADWIEKAPKELLDRFAINPKIYNDYKVLPRLLFGQYLSAQFDLLKKKADKVGITYTIHYESSVTDIIDQPEEGCVQVEVAGDTLFDFDHVIVCTGHNWPCRHEESIPGYFDSPYPPSKLFVKVNNAIAIRGASLTAVDALRTLARHNGKYDKDEKGKLFFTLDRDCPNFKMVLHSRNGLLPAVRFHLEDSHLQNDDLLTEDEIDTHIADNDGFLSLDYVFEKDFKEILKDKQPEFYKHIKNMDLEGFVTAMMDKRESLDPFVLLKAEYEEAERSIKNHQSVYWKEMLGVLSFAMNYPAKYLSAEDMQRLQKVLSPLISIVIAYIPQSSCEEIFALHNAGVLEIVSVGDDSEVKAESKGGATYSYANSEGEAITEYYKTYVDCVGQPHLPFEDFPYQSLVTKQTVSPARLRFRSVAEGEKAFKSGNDKIERGSDETYYLKVPGITINDNFQVVDKAGEANERIYVMAVPYIGGYNPDYSGLDFCEEASGSIIGTLLLKDEQPTTISN